MPGTGMRGWSAAEGRRSCCRSGARRSACCPTPRCSPGKVVLNSGDTLVVFSDGLLDLRPDLATKEVPLPLAARRAPNAQELVDILATGSRDRDLPDDVTVLALRRI